MKLTTFVLLLAIILSACAHPSTPTPLPSPTPMPLSPTAAPLLEFQPGDVLLTEDFSTNVTTRMVWDILARQLSSTSSCNVNAEVRDGAFYIVVGTPSCFTPIPLSRVNPDPNSKVMLPWPPDVDVTFDAVLKEGQLAGVLCRVTNTSEGLQSFYQFTVSGSQRFVVRRGKVGEGMTQLAASTSATAIRSGANTIRVVCSGDQLQLFVNGTELATVRDDSLSAGDLWLHAQVENTTNAEVRVDNLVVRAAESPSKAFASTTAMPASTYSAAKEPTLGTSDETEAAVILQDVPWLVDLVAERYSAPPPDRTFTYTIRLSENKPLLWDYAWCATTDAILKDNLKHIKVQFFVNDSPVDVSHIYTYIHHTPGTEAECYELVTIVSNWPKAKTQLKTGVTIDAKINDGTTDHAAGPWTFEYTVTPP